MESTSDTHRVSLQDLCELFDRLRNGVFFWNSDLTLSTCNALGCQLYGLDPAFMTPGRDFMEMVAALPPGRFVREKASTHWQPLHASELRQDVLEDFHRGVTFEMRFAGENGRVLIGSRATFRDGGLASVVRDVTALQANARELDRQRTYLETIIENLEEGTALVDPAGRVVTYNRRILELYGVDPSAVRSGEHVSHFIHAATDIAGLPDARREAITRERLERVARARPGKLEFERQRPDGRSIQGTRVGLTDGSAVLVARDVTDRVALAREHADLAAIVDNISEGVVLLDRRNRLIACNDHVLEHFGIERGDIGPGDHVSCLIVRERDLEGFQPEERERRLAERVEFALGQEQGPAETRRELGDGRVLAVARTPLEGMTLFTFRDVTAEEERRRLLERAREEAEKASRMQSEFLARMSHELRTPMQGVLGMAAVLERSDLDSRQRQCLDVVRACGQHMLELVEDLLTLSAMDARGLSLDPVRGSLARPVNEAVDIVRPQSREKGLSILIESCPPDDLVVEVDAKRLRQILINVLGNAVRYTSRGGITVSCAVAPTQVAGRVGVEIAVSDTGPGISKEFQEEIFERFRQLERQDRGVKEGVGLGLSVARSLARAMGGDLTVQSEPGGGATFTLRLELPEASGRD